MPPDDDLIDAAPCPKCHAPLAVAEADLGHLIECPTCGTQSRARRAAAPPPPADEETPRRRNWDDDRDREEERPRRRRRSLDDDDEVLDRRRRDRYRDDEDDYDRPSRRPGQGAAVGAAVMNFVFAAIGLLEGICVGFGGSSLLFERQRFGGGGGGGPFGSPENAGMVFLGFGVCNLLGVGLMIPSGIGLLTRRSYGRTLGFVAAGLGLINALAIVVLFLVIVSEARGGPPVGAVVFFLFPVLLWLAYAVTNLILLSKVRPQPR